METLKVDNQNKVDNFLNELTTNESIKSIATFFNKDIKEVCQAVQKFITILYYRNGVIKEVNINFLETQSNIKIIQKHKY